MLSFTAQKWSTMASSFQAKGKHTTSDLEDTNKNIHEKGMNCLILLTCTDQCSYVFLGKTKCATPVNYACEFLACIISSVCFHGTPRSNKSLIDEITTL